MVIDKPMIALCVALAITVGCGKKSEPEEAAPATFKLDSQCSKNPSGFSLAESQSSPGSSKMHFVNAGLKICGMEIRRIKIAGKNFYLGSQPPASAPQNIVDEYISADDARALAMKKLGNPRDAAASFGDPEQCLTMTADALVPTWEFDMRVDQKSYFARVIGKRDQLLSKHGFDAVEANIFAENPSHERVNIALDGIDPTGTLCNTYFEASPSDPNNPAIATNDRLDFATDDSRFYDTSAFANASEMMKWFVAHGYEWDQQNIVIAANNKTARFNNAQYFPIDGIFYHRPVIEIGLTDGIMFRNLSTDADVVGHELGHHIVQKTLKAKYKDYEELVIHEGLSDFFRFAKTGDACLAESICTKENTFCAVQNKCLRTADNTMDLTEARKNREHVASQFLSGFMWDLTNATGFNRDLTASLALKALSYLPEHGNLRDFLLALLLADQTLHKGVHACKIDETARQRGMAELLEGVSCQSFVVP